ncbi:PREDICTED: LOW QUALITY PROTEIN: general transcription factor 3C polypeptide 5-like [Pygoscelis adeliae]|uniref:LOW QUALITY PROTEIN: general transcription factor 3C polypeptide 5-like n=1 Tax=Pygoscelis adeliae TaxID=9238 RepID=UPI0004F4DF72|nr:PREDICTED: LOW QUALITY PROTEIN: general transcription factor 3C polypeptide 5-like [Pygoscelis adeliae]
MVSRYVIPKSLGRWAPREGYNNPQVSGENLIGLSRARRPHNAIFVNFDDEEIPTKPLDAAVQTWKKVCTNPVDKKVEEELRKLFEVRPVWSRNAVKANISVHPDKLKLLLLYLAYYMDARSQTLGRYAPNDMPVKAKRSTYNYSLPITVKKPGTRCQQKGFLWLNSSEDGKEQLAYESGEDEDDEEEEEEDFKPSDGSENEMETEILDYV